MLHPPPILAFGLTSLPMLGWLAAAAVPILIHLWSRRNYRRMSWAAMEYLLAAVRRHSRRLHFEQLLLLALRTLLIVLLVLAVAQPFLERAGVALTSAGGRTHRVLVIDASYSMAYKTKDATRFDRARQLARQIVEESRQGDAFTLVLMAAPPRVVVGTPALDPGEVLREIDALQMPHGTADLSATVAAVEKIVASARSENRRLTGHEVYFLTDLGRVGWVPELSGTALAEFRKASKRLAELATLVVIDIGQPAAENIAITDLRLQEPVPTVGQSIGVVAALKNFGRQTRAGQRVELLVDGRPVQQKSVDLGPEATAEAAFSCRFDAPGDHHLEVRAEGDALDVDNHRFLAVPVRQSIRVLCIDGHPSGEPFRCATDYLAVALAPQDSRAERPLVEVEVVAESALLERDLGRYDCVFLCDVAQFTANEARVLDAYLRRGGSLVFFLGDAVLADRYNLELGGAGGPHILPARLDQVVAEPAYRLDPLDYRHPMVRAFRGREQAGLLTTPVYKHFRLSLPKTSPAKVVLQTSEGDPLVVEESIHRGRVVLVATSADASWTDMPAWPSYVPLVQEMLAWCVGQQLQQRSVLVGQPLEASIAGPADDGPLTLQGPDGRTREVRPTPGTEDAMLSFADTTLSGIYTLRFRPPNLQTESFAVNVDTVESDLTQAAVDRLRNEVWPGIPFVHQTTWQNPEQPPAGPIVRRGSLSIGLLYGVLGLLFVESLLAWRFGYYGR